NASKHAYAAHGWLGSTSRSPGCLQNPRNHTNLSRSTPFETASEIINAEEGGGLVEGNEFDNVINGTAGNDELQGGGALDIIKAGAGDDTAKGGANRDKLYGGEGDDTLYGQGSNDKLYGGEGDDYLDGGGQNDRLYGGDGSDTIIGGDGDDVLYGDNPNDDNDNEAFEDFFVFDADDGNDKVFDFESGIDHVVLTEGVAYELSYDLPSGNTFMTYGATTVIFYDTEVLDSDIMYA
ncbi:MAG: calcium-binding protein, partial [Pseudomonadota bacterium]|nr:calcium-binding protein [Pseudomonadota bacterium]